MHGGYVYSTKAYIVHHACKHHANWFRSVPCVVNAQGQSHNLGTHDSCTCRCLALDVATSSTIQNISPHMEHDRLKDTCMGYVNVYNTNDDTLHHICKYHVTVVCNLYLVWLATSICI